MQSSRRYSKRDVLDFLDATVSAAAAACQADIEQQRRHLDALDEKGADTKVKRLTELGSQIDKLEDVRAQLVADIDAELLSLREQRVAVRTDKVANAEFDARVAAIQAASDRAASVKAQIDFVKLVWEKHPQPVYSRTHDAVQLLRMQHSGDFLPDMNNALRVADLVTCRDAAAVAEYRVTFHHQADRSAARAVSWGCNAIIPANDEPHAAQRLEPWEVTLYGDAPKPELFAPWELENIDHSLSVECDGVRRQVGTIARVMCGFSVPPRFHGALKRAREEANGDGDMDDMPPAKRKRVAFSDSDDE